VAESSFAGTTVVVTGAGQGIGLAIARRFAEAGAHAVLAELDPARGAEAAGALRRDGLDATFAPLDVRDPAQSAALVERLVAARGAIDVWVNNAGLVHRGAAESLARADWEDSLAVLLSGPFYCAQAVGRSMLARGRGVIVNVASVDASAPIAGRSAYSVAKAGLVALTEALGIEWASRGVRVVGVAPGIILTDLVRQGVAAGAASLAGYERRTPLRRLGTPDEVADAVLYLASDEATYVTAETLRVDGGWTAYQLF